MGEGRGGEWHRLVLETWGLLRRCLHLDKPPLSNKIQRNYKGLKIIACACTVGTNYKQEPNCQSWGARSKHNIAHAPCAWQHPESGQMTESPPLSPLIRNHRLPHLRQQGNKLLLVFAPSCCSRIPNKASPEFLVWPLLNFCWLRGPRTLLSNKVSKERTGGVVRWAFQDC